ncbi:tetratricopeptide repeat protein [Flavobacterium sp.]|uniref:tetratricopeptide repeat protein n=1 Tax=Flavobacterium sp. TaxID=239 RepID=UPI0031D2ED61
MGILDFLWRKNLGIEESKFNSSQFQHEVCALALAELEGNGLNPDTAIYELEKLGLSNEQINSVLEKVNLFLEKEKKSNNIHELKQQETDFEKALDSGAISEIKIIPNPDHVKENTDSDQVDKYIGFGAYQMDRGDFDNALELFDKAIELDEKATLAYANKGTLYTRKNDNEKALYFYNKALEIEPDNLQILENKMDLLFEMMTESNESEFIETVKNILKKDETNPNALIFIIQFYLKNNEMEKALIDLKKLFSMYHREHVVIDLLLTTFHKLSKERALSEFVNFKKDFDEQAKYQLDYCRGLYLKGLGDFDEAINQFEEINKIHEFSWNYYQIAIMKNRQDKIQECFKYLKTTFELEPGLKNDAKQYPELQNLWLNQEFIELTN